MGPERSDGYHNIHTIFQSIGMYDRLTVQFTSNGSDQLTVTGRQEGVPTDKENLVLRTLNRVRASGIDIPGCRIKLEKRIPNRAGLGGASSDAAALLKILRSHVGDDHEKDVLFETIARQLGADVSYFLIEGTTEATGRGDEFRRLQDMDGWALVIIPPYGVDTQGAYHRLEQRKLVRDSVPNEPTTYDGEDWEDLDLTNDFLSLVSDNNPIQDRLLNRLGEFTDYCSLTGSGSALYGLFKSRQEGRNAREQFGTEFPDVEFKLVELLGRNDIPELEREDSCRLK